MRLLFSDLLTLFTT